MLITVTNFVLFQYVNVVSSITLFTCLVHCPDLNSDCKDCLQFELPSILRRQITQKYPIHIPATSNFVQFSTLPPLKHSSSKIQQFNSSTLQPRRHSSLKNPQFNFSTPKFSSSPPLLTSRPADYLLNTTEPTEDIFDENSTTPDSPNVFETSSTLIPPSRTYTDTTNSTKTFLVTIEPESDKMESQKRNTSTPPFLVIAKNSVRYSEDSGVQTYHIFVFVGVILLSTTAGFLICSYCHFRSNSFGRRLDQCVRGIRHRCGNLNRSRIFQGAAFPGHNDGTDSVLTDSSGWYGYGYDRTSFTSLKIQDDEQTPLQTCARNLD